MLCPRQDAEPIKGVRRFGLGFLMRICAACLDRPYLHAFSYPLEHRGKDMREVHYSDFREARAPPSKGTDNPQIRNP